jgi:hypothetical protein
MFYVSAFIANTFVLISGFGGKNVGVVIFVISILSLA